MSNHLKQWESNPMSKADMIRCIVLVCLYSLLFHFIFTHSIRIDYSSFYSCSKALFQGDNPYQSLYTTYLPTVKKISLNINPPIVLMLFMPLSKMGYSASLILWSSISIVFGLITASVSFKLAFKPAFLRQHRTSLYLIYFAFFPPIINLAIGQLGTLIGFFVITGYYFYTKKQDIPAAIMWGIIIAMKFFPGLLFFYALKQRRYKVMGIMAVTVAIISIIPYLAYGAGIYSNYFNMLSHLTWYGDNWNASFNGFLFRVLTDAHSTAIDLFLVKYLYVILFFISLIWYLKKIDSKTDATAQALSSNVNRVPSDNHHAFSLTLVMMLLMSPFGWIYYFPLMILPLCLTWSDVSALHAGKKMRFAWILCLFLINFPMNYLPIQHVTSGIEQWTLHSFYFYGLCLLVYLLTRANSNMTCEKRQKQTPLPASNGLFTSIQSILTFGVLILSMEFILQSTSH